MLQTPSKAASGADSKRTFILEKRTIPLVAVGLTLLLRDRQLRLVDTRKAGDCQEETAENRRKPQRRGEVASVTQW
jgi:hypothetical protein